ncbi:MAG: HD-GYP domain-containing protein [Myxococcota bacterium]
MGGLARPHVGVCGEAPSCEEGRRILGDRVRVTHEASEAVDLWIVGWSQIEQDGAALLRRLRLRGVEAPRIALTAAGAGGDLVRACYRAGASEVVGQEELREELPRALSRALSRARTRADREMESSQFARELGERTRHLEKALRAVSDAYDQTLTALVSAQDCRERETAFHSQRVAAYSVLLGAELELDRAQLEELYRGALLHDIGKIGIPDAILLKPGALSDSEWAVMRSHVELGGEILRGIHFLERSAAVPLSHHEAWDGSGYPRGLRELEIPLYARLFAIPDTYDALRSERSYKPAWNHGEAVAQILEEAGTRLDPGLAKLFSRLPEGLLLRIEDDVEESWSFRDTLSYVRSVRPR